MLVAVAFARTSLGNALPRCDQGKGGVLTSCSVVFQKTEAIHRLVSSPSPAIMKSCC
jgi:hypothetical protein